MTDLTTGSPVRRLILFAIPMILSTTLQSIYQIVDAIWVGRLLGAAPFAAVSVSVPLIFSLMSVFIGLSVSTNILVGQAFGAKNHGFLAQVSVNSFLVTLVLALAFTALGIALGRPMLVLMNTPPALLDDAYTFLACFSIGLLFLFVNNWMMGVLRGLGDGNTPLVLTALSVAINIVLVPFLIRGIGPVPPLGIAGSALATVAANLVATVAGLAWLISRNELFDLRKWKWRLDLGIVRELFTLGVPASLQVIIVSLSSILLMGIVNRFGQDVIGAYGIGIRVDNLAFIPAMSVSMAASAMVAQCLGAGKGERVDATMRAAVLLASGFCAVLLVVLNLFPLAIARVFTDDAGVLSHTEGYFRIMSVNYWIFSIFFIYMGAIRGSGEMLRPLLIIGGVMASRVVLSWFLSGIPALHEVGIWLAILITTIFGLVAMVWYFRAGKWRERVVVHGDGKGLVGGTVEVGL